MTHARPARAIAVVLGVLALASGSAGCGGSSDGPSKERLGVGAATSLEGALERYAGSYEDADVRLSFAGSDVVAAQIRQGARLDLFAAANTELPEALHRAGLVEEPVEFARNTLVIATPAGSSIESLDELAGRGLHIVIGSRSVPVGAYAHQVLDRLPSDQRGAIERNIRSEEPDASSALAKVVRRAADAAFVYATDVRAAGGAVRAVTIPGNLRPNVSYAAAVPVAARHPAAARRFVRGLLAGRGASALRAAGFLPPDQ